VSYYLYIIGSFCIVLNPFHFFVFSLFSGSAVINRCGFNSEGIVVVAKRLGAQHGKRKMEETSGSSHDSNPATTTANNNPVKQGGKAGPGILGVNLGKNKNSEDAVADYVQGVHTLSQYADYLVRY
jgi:dihydroorotate dehydrogenase